MTEYNVKENMAHQPPMLLVDEVLEADAARATTTFLIKEESIFIDADGKFARAALIEVMAQSFAAGNAYNCVRENRAQEKGFLVGLRDIKIYADACVNDLLTCKVEKADFVAQTYIIKGRVFKGESLLAEGELRLFAF
ncbi:putative hotdog family 3-hydroxylacyl-ACP dehydratase [Elusimicrobium posterum]|uniref:hypothetical protein n=1 Tax=Elusimicrobium posterum TaxID=3116653 RepID=UPI003C764D92